MTTTTKPSTLRLSPAQSWALRKLIANGCEVRSAGCAEMALGPATYRALLVRGALVTRCDADGVRRVVVTDLGRKAIGVAA